MIEVKTQHVERHTGFNGHNSAVVINKGVFMYNSGAAFAAAHIPIGTPGYASLGDTPRMLRAGATTHSGFGVFPVNKLILATQGSDQSLDTIPSGARMLFYIGGEFETDEYDVTVSGVGTVPGDKLWLNDSGQISLSVDAAVTSADPAGWGLAPIGVVVKVSDFPSTSDWNNGGNPGGSAPNAFKKTVWYRLYRSHAEPCGNAGFR